jgi:hypothetical protein
MAEEKKGDAKFDPEAFSCALLTSAVFMLLGFIVLYMIEHKDDEVGHLIGRVKSCETFESKELQMFSDSDGKNVVRVYPTNDRCRITFEDGRSKVLFGLPAEAVPIDRDVAVFWKRGEELLGWENADDHKRRHANEKTSKLLPESQK